MSELKAVIYTRYSSSSQREESIEGQIRECTAYAERNGYMVIGTYIDRAISGTTDNRPDFQKIFFWYHIHQSLIDLFPDIHMPLHMFHME